MVRTKRKYVKHPPQGGPAHPNCRVKVKRGSVMWSLTPSRSLKKISIKKRRWEVLIPILEFSELYRTQKALEMLVSPARLTRVGRGVGPRVRGRNQGPSCCRNPREVVFIKSGNAKIFACPSATSKTAGHEAESGQRNCKEKLLVVEWTQRLSLQVSY